MTQSEHARATLMRLTARFDKEAAGLLKDHGEDPVHDFRVSIRRLSQGLRVFEDLVPNRQARKMRKALKPAMSAAAIVRDLDVGVELLLKEGLTEEHAYIARLRTDREREALGLLGQAYLLRSKEIPHSWLPMFEMLMPADEDAALGARELLPAEAVEFFKTGRKAAIRGDSPQRLHAFRLAAKRFRYTLEIYREFYGPVFDARLDRVREIQSLLGKRQDCAVMVERLQPLATIDAPLQEMLDKLQHKGAKIENEFRDFWHKTFDAEGEEARWEHYLARRPAARERATPIQ